MTDMSFSPDLAATGGPKTDRDARASLSERLGEKAWRCGYLLALTLTVTLIFFNFVSKPGINRYDHAQPVAMVQGRAWRPFVYRALLPLCVRAILAVTPAPARKWVVDAAQADPSLRILCENLRWEPEHFDLYLVLCSLMYLSLFGFAAAMRALLATVYDLPDRFLDVAALVAVAVVPSFFAYVNYIYDFTTLVLFTICLTLLIQRRWLPFLGVYLLTCINKETAILLPALFVLFYAASWKSEPRRFWGLLGAQAVLFLVVRIALRAVYGHNPGGDVEWHLLDHNLNLLVPVRFTTLYSVLAFLLLCGFRWSEKPRVARLGVIVLPVLLGLTCFLGYLDEYRDYYEAYPAVLLLLAHTAACILGVRCRVRPAGEATRLSPAAT